MNELADIEEANKAFVPAVNSKIDYKPTSLGNKGYFVLGVITHSTKEEKKEKSDKGPTKYHLTISFVMDGQSKSNFI